MPAGMETLHIQQVDILLLSDCFFLFILEENHFLVTPFPSIPSLGGFSAPPVSTWIGPKRIHLSVVHTSGTPGPGAHRLQLRFGT